MSNDKTKKVSIFSILIFILCGLIAAYAVASAIYVTKYIGEMVEYGQITVSESIYDILNYYVSSCGVYLIYIAILLSIWWVYHKMVSKNAATETVEIEKIIEPDKETLIEKVTTENVDMDAVKSTLEKEIEEAEKYDPESAKVIKEAMNIPIDDEDNK